MTRIATVLMITSCVVALSLTAAVAIGRFSDDDGNIHELSIEAIAAAGITSGCNPPANDLFCPSAPVTRGQMAAFLNRALDLPASTRNAFTDDDASIFQADIQALAAAGITKGCNPPANDRFCPDSLVSRGQMAAFLTRALNLPSSTVNTFTDDDGSIFEADIQALAAAGVTSGCNPPANDRYCPEVMVTRGQMASFLFRALDLPVPDFPPPKAGQITFTAGGDIGAGADTNTTMAKLADQKGDFFLALGDLSYSDVVPESAWCNYIKGYLGSTVPVQLIVGNHEDDDLMDGFIGDFAACLPDRMSSTGTYGAEYYFDVDGLARFIMIGAGNDVDGVKYDYNAGNARYQWLANAIDGARADGIPWVIVGMHKPCLTAGEKTCEIGTDLAELLVAKKVDLVLSGHDHSYQRSHQLDCVTVDSYQASCVSDSGFDDSYGRGKGTVFVIAGLTGGSGLYDVNPADPEFPYFAATLGRGDPLEGRGFFRATITSTALTGSFVGSTTSFTDSFVIH